MLSDNQHNLSSSNIHGTCVEINGQGILILGKSGAGKSDLAMRLIVRHGGKLVADDRVNLEEKNTFILASAPTALNGLLEVRGVGIVKLPSVEKTRLCLVVELIDDKSLIERLPENESCIIKTCELPLLKLYPFEISAADKLVIKLNALLD